ncbi:MAG: hypothetical protein R3C53_16655 [Pirellulaceae bacterium]
MSQKNGEAVAAILSLIIGEARKNAHRTEIDSIRYVFARVNSTEVVLVVRGAVMDVYN